MSKETVGHSVNRALKCPEVQKSLTDLTLALLPVPMDMGVRMGKPGGCLGSMPLKDIVGKLWTLGLE
jgi:hypothetical protein